MKGQICWDDISEGKAGNGGGCGFEDGVDGGGPCYECGG